MTVDLEVRAEIKNQEFESAIALHLEDIEAFSVGSNPECEGCDEHSDEGHFSWQHCDSCGSRLGGDRYPAHGIVQLRLRGKSRKN